MEPPKGKEIYYRNYLVCQNYLLPNKLLTLKEQQDIFAYRTRMNKLQYNFSKSNSLQLCMCKQQMTNDHLYICDIMNSVTKLNISYSKIFHGTISEQKKIIIKLNENMNIFENFTQGQNEASLSH